MTCQFRDTPPDESPCYCTATFRAVVPAAWGILRLAVCDHHAATLRDQGAETWPLEGE